MTSNSCSHTPCSSPPNKTRFYRHLGNRLGMVDPDEARSLVLSHNLRPDSLKQDSTSDEVKLEKLHLRTEKLNLGTKKLNLGTTESSHNSTYSSTETSSPTTTSIQYVEDPSLIEQIFRFDKETLGLFGTARQKHRKQPEKIKMEGMKQEKGDQENQDEGKKKNSHCRAVLHNVVDLRTMETKVIKTIEKTKLPASSGGDRLWRRLCHKLLRVTNKHNGLMHVTDVIETDSMFYIVTERLEGGELFEFLLMERAVPEELCKYLINQILHSLDFLHLNSLLHRDVKPENLMFRRARPLAPSSFSSSSPNSSSLRSLTPGSLASTTDTLPILDDRLSHQSKSNKPRYLTSLECSQLMSLEELRVQFELAIIDFDTCKMTDIPSSDYREVSNGRRRLVGTYGYLAPEVLRGHEYTIQSDLWSVGIILYILMTGVPPIPMDMMVNARAALEVLQEAKNRGIDFQLAPFPDFPKAQDLCRSLLEFDPACRITSARASLNHPWLNPSASNSVPFDQSPTVLLHSQIGLDERNIGMDERPLKKTDLRRCCQPHQLSRTLGHSRQSNSDSHSPPPVKHLINTSPTNLRSETQDRPVRSTLNWTEVDGSASPIGKFSFRLQHSKRPSPSHRSSKNSNVVLGLQT